jgi:nucleoid-associated protein YgaU
VSDVSSRFNNAATYTRTVERGGPDLILYEPRPLPSTTQVLSHQVAPGDRLDLLAQRYYNDPFQYWRIVDANPTLTPEELLEPGRLLKIPRGG